MDRPH